MNTLSAPWLALLVALVITTPVWAQVDENTDALIATTSQVVELSQADTESTDTWFTTDFVIGDPLVGDFVVGPGRIELNANPGETIVTEITVTNRISDNRQFRLEVADVTGSADGSSALDLVEGDNPGPYSIRDYISFPQDVFTLALGERAKIPVTISIPAAIDPGGLYGTVLVSTIQAPAETGELNVPRNPIIARVGSHIFLNIAGETVVAGQTLDLRTLPSSLWYESGPLTFAISYENTGSVHLNPYGELRVRNTFGQEVGYVELEPWFVLPTSLRTREIEWDRDFLFGRYTATAAVNRGYNDIVDEVTVTFWVLPWKILLTVFLSTLVVTFLFRLLFKNFSVTRK